MMLVNEIATVIDYKSPYNTQHCCWFAVFTVFHNPRSS